MAIRTKFAVIAAAVALGGTLAAPAGTTSAAHEPSQRGASEQGATSSYLPNSLDKAQNKRLQKALDIAKARAKAAKANGAAPREAATTVYYDASQAPSFAGEISSTAQIWDDAVDNVTLVENPSQASLTFVEGSSPNGSYYQGDGHGSGTIFIDYDQAGVYNPLRIVSHETGHALGLPDRYTQPCSKLMSGGGPGPSCTNPYPDSVESQEVETIWQFGLQAGLQPAA